MQPPKAKLTFWSSTDNLVKEDSKTFHSKEQHLTTQHRSKQKTDTWGLAMPPSYPVPTGYLKDSCQMKLKDYSQKKKVVKKNMNSLTLGPWFNV